MRRFPLVIALCGGLFAAAFAASCFDEPKPTCAFTCNTGSDCPSGYACGDDDRCHLLDGDGNPLACETPLTPDASTADGGAGSDGSVTDGGLEDAVAAADAGPFDAQAAVDASAADASTPDASAADASLPDASLPDASLPDASLPDASPTCSASLAPTADGAAAAGQALVIAEIDPGDYLELYNNTGAAIDLSATTYQLCSPFDYRALSVLAPTTIIPAGGRAVVPWPSNFSDTDAGGEVILYADGNFGASASIVDFICWGSNPTGSRMAQAVTVGKWAGACAGAITGGAVHRIVATAGTVAADYDVASAPSGETCSP